MGKVMAKSDVIFGEHKAIELKSYNSHFNELAEIIEANIGAHRHHDVDWIEVHEKQAEAEKDSAMHDAHVKVGVIDGDLIWRAKADRFTGPKEYDAILVRHYTHLVSEYQRLLKENEENEIDDEAEPTPSPAAPKPAPARRAGGGPTTTKATQVADSSEEFKASLAELKMMPGYFASLNADGAKEKLAGQPINSWLLRASSGGGVTWSRREDDDDQPVKHWRIANQKDYNDFHKFIEGKGKGKQVTR